MSGALGALHWLVAGGALAAVVVAVVSDARRLIIPNWTSAATAALFVPAALIAGLPPTTIAVHLGIGLALLALGAALFAGGLLGGGDVKLLAATGTWIGLPEIGPFLFWVALLGGGLALVVAAAGRSSGRLAALRRIPWLAPEGGRRQALPYGIAIGLAWIYFFPGNSAVPAAWKGLVGS